MCESVGDLGIHHEAQKESICMCRGTKELVRVYVFWGNMFSVTYVALRQTLGTDWQIIAG